METRGADITTVAENVEDIMLRAGYSAAEIASMSAIKIYRTGANQVYWNEGPSDQGMQNSVPFTEIAEMFAPPYNTIWLRSQVASTRVVFVRLS